MIENQDTILLLRLTADGDKYAFTRFAENISGRVLAIAFKITGDKMHSEDVLNTVLLKVWQNIEKLIKLEKVIEYINTIAYNAAFDVMRKKQALSLYDDNVPASENDHEARIDIKTALNILNEQSRQIVLYHIHAGYSFREIAELMNLTKKVVYTKYIAATKKMKEILS